MKKVLAFIPASVDKVPELFVDQQQLDVVVANKELMQTFQIDANQKESVEIAEMAALQIASVLALAKFGHRFVLTAEVDPKQLSPAEEPENGQMCLTGLSQSQVTAFFTDAEGIKPSAELLEQLATADLDEAWQLSQDFMRENDLLWHGIDEIES